MNLKLVLTSVIFLVLFCFSCQKSSTTTSSTSFPPSGNIDSMKGYYAGITSGDSLYYYTDGSGKVQYAIRSFSLPDSMIITAADTMSITVATRFYNFTCPYYFYLTTIDTVSYLQTDSAGVGNYVLYNTTLIDTANGINHIAINVSYGYSKNYSSTFALYKRQ